MKKTLNRVIATILLAILTAAPTYATCAPDTCVGPCTYYEELLYDTRFSGNCPQWVWTGNPVYVKRVKVGTNWLAELGAVGNVTQSVSTGSYSRMDVAFDVYITPTNSGTERLYVEILRGSSIIETVAVIYPDSGGGDYNLSIDNYSNDNIKIRFRYGPGTSPGNTVYRIDNAVMFGTFV